MPCRAAGAGGSRHHGMDSGSTWLYAFDLIHGRLPLTDGPGQEQGLLQRWRENDVSPRSGEKICLWLDGMELTTWQQLSDQEYLTLHAEVLALQDKLGISYKDASHRLYLAEMEKLKVADEKYKAFKNLKVRIGEFMRRVNKDFAECFTDDEPASEAGPSVKNPTTAEGTTE